MEGERKGHTDVLEEERRKERKNAKNRRGESEIERKRKAESASEHSRE